MTFLIACACVSLVIIAICAVANVGIGMIEREEQLQRQATLKDYGKTLDAMAAVLRDGRPARGFPPDLAIVAEELARVGATPEGERRRG